MKRAENVAFGHQKLSLCPRGMLVEKIAAVPVVPERFRPDGSHQVCEDQLECILDLVMGRLGVSKLVAHLHGADVMIWRDSVEAHSFVVFLLQEVQDFVVEVFQPLIPQVGVNRSLRFSSGALLSSVRFREKG